MTGEMAQINQDGVDSNGEVWELHAAIANAVGGELKPFDKYQGPYISVGFDLVVNEGAMYSIPVQRFGCIRLWLIENDQDYMYPYVYREDNEQCANFDLYDVESAICAARSLL